MMDSVKATTFLTTTDTFVLHANPSFPHFEANSPYRSSAPVQFPGSCYFFYRIQPPLFGCRHRPVTVCQRTVTNQVEVPLADSASGQNLQDEDCTDEGKKLLLALGAVSAQLNLLIPLLSVFGSSRSPGDPYRNVALKGR
jgi:hypothetical protein